MSSSCSEPSPHSQPSTASGKPVSQENPTGQNHCQPHRIVKRKLERKLTPPPRAAQSVNLEPWFGPHLQRNIYLTLLHMNPEDDAAADEKTPRVPDSVLKAALLRRAVEDLQRLMQVRTAKQACSSLLQRGSVGDDLWKRFQRAEKEMEEELRDVVTEVSPPYPRDVSVPFCSVV